MTQDEANAKIAKDAAKIANDMVSWNDPAAGKIFRPDNSRTRTGLGLSIEPVYLQSLDEAGVRHVKIMAREAMVAAVKKNQKLVTGMVIAKALNRD